MTIELTDFCVVAGEGYQGRWNDRVWLLVPVANPRAHAAGVARNVASGPGAIVPPGRLRMIDTPSGEKHFEETGQ
jgi:hypothetical protein